MWNLNKSCIDAFCTAWNKSVRILLRLPARTHRCLLRPRDGVAFEGEKIGGGPPCVLTTAGWVQIYHGKSAAGAYALFAALLDREDPTIRRDVGLYQFKLEVSGRERCY